MVTDWSEELKSPSPIPKIPSTSEASGPKRSDWYKPSLITSPHFHTPLTGYHPNNKLIILVFCSWCSSYLFGMWPKWPVGGRGTLSTLQAQVKRPSHCHGRLLFAVDSFELVVEKYPSPSKLLLSMSVKPCVEEQALEPATPPISYQRKKHTTYQSKRWSLCWIPNRKSSHRRRLIVSSAYRNG